MPRPIKEGDRVSAIFTTPEPDGTKITGVVINVPYATGDLWYVRDDQDQVFAFNPGSSNLEYFLLLPGDVS